MEEIDLTQQLDQFKLVKLNAQNGAVPLVLKSENGGKESKSCTEN
jgi:hypothetical protein